MKRHLSSSDKGGPQLEGGGGAAGPQLEGGMGGSRASAWGGEGGQQGLSLRGGGGAAGAACVLLALICISCRGCIKQWESLKACAKHGTNGVRLLHHLQRWHLILAASPQSKDSIHRRIRSLCLSAYPCPAVKFVQLCIYSSSAMLQADDL